MLLPHQTTRKNASILNVPKSKEVHWVWVNFLHENKVLRPSGLCIIHAPISITSFAWFCSSVLIAPHNQVNIMPQWPTGKENLKLKKGDRTIRIYLKRNYAFSEQVDSPRHLEITFDSNLTWKNHIIEVCLKSSKSVNGYLV